jgi:hypothetical protein
VAWPRFSGAFRFTPSMNTPRFLNLEGVVGEIIAIRGVIETGLPKCPAEKRAAKVVSCM